MTHTRKLLAFGCTVALFSLAMGQPPRERPSPDGKKEEGRPSIVERLMSFDKNKDGKLTKDEVTDERLQRLFDEADTNKDGKVTKEELTALVKKLDERQGDERGPGGRGPGGPGGRGPGGPGGPGGRGPGGPPQPGQLLSPGLVERLQLTDAQKKQLEALQKEVNGKLDKILTEEQRKQMKEMRERGPGGPGGPGGRGPGGEGGPGGRPRPDGEGGRPRPDGEKKPE